MQSTKLKTLLIYKYLRKFSDEENPLSSHQLIVNERASMPM